MGETAFYNITFIVGYSMFPTLQPGDEVMSLETSDIRVGDVVCCRIDNKGVVHRITAIEKDNMLIRGDNNQGNDPSPVAPHEIVGKVVKIRRKNRVLKVKNGLPGRLAALKCRVVKKMKSILYKFYGI